MSPQTASLLSLALTMTSLLALSATGCAAPEDDGAESSQGAIQTGASVRSGLKDGVYEGGGVRIGVSEATSTGKLMVVVELERPSATYNNRMIEVSAGGTVTVGDPDGPTIDESPCHLKLDVSKNNVHASGTCGVTKVDAQLVRQTPAMLVGNYDCAANLDSDTFKLVIGTKSNEATVDLKIAPVDSTRLVAASATLAWFTVGNSFEINNMFFSRHPFQKNISVTAPFGKGVCTLAGR